MTAPETKKRSLICRQKLDAWRKKIRPPRGATQPQPGCPKLSKGPVESSLEIRTLAYRLTNAFLTFPAILGNGLDYHNKT